jgi:hypothetical protein
MLDHPSVIRLREGLSELTTGTAKPGAAFNHDLRDQVCVVVEELRALGWPPERVIIAVKQVAVDMGLKTSRNVLVASGQPTPNDEIVQRLVRWCIEQYYGTAGRS